MKKQVVVYDTPTSNAHCDTAVFIPKSMCVDGETSTLLPLLLSVHSSFCLDYGAMANPNGTNVTALNESPHRIALVVTYSVVLTTGSVGLLHMMSLLKSNLRTWTAINFLNLIIAHFMFLLTVPFRIYYYVTDVWDLPSLLCKVVSAMIHLHMHVVFVIYVGILTVHFLQYYKKTNAIEFHRKLHAVVASIGIWSILLVVGPVILHHYGTRTDPNEQKCFNFANEFTAGPVFWFNIILSVTIVLVSFIISTVFGVILYMMFKKHGANLRNQQDFSAQMKNASLVLIILICLLPYHLFRLYYLNHTTLETDNEVFLALTTLTCLDMLFIFAGKGVCQMCGG